MNNRQLAQIGLGLTGVWALVYALAGFIQIVGIVRGGVAPLVLAEVIPEGLLLGVSYLLVFHTAGVATAIFLDVDGATDVASPDLARTLVVLTGVLLLVQAAPSAVNAVLNLAAGEGDPSSRGALFQRVLVSLVPVACGIYLMARPWRLLDYIQRPLPNS